MLIERFGNLFTTTATHIGHGVNTSGVMGAGIAAQFKERFYDNFLEYRDACQNGTLLPGQVLATQQRVTNPDMTTETIVIHNIASQEKPGRNANLAYLTHGLYDSMHIVNREIFRGFRALAIPMIGAGIGGLASEDVMDVFRVMSWAWPNCDIEVWTI